MTRTGSTSGGTVEMTGSGPSRLEPIVVQVVDGPDKGASFELASGLLVVGSHRASDFRIGDRTVSGKHAALELLPGAVRVRDLGSRNGTFYLSSRISDVKIKLGGSVRLGQTTLRFSPRAPGLAVSEKTEFHGLLGWSVAMRRLFSQIEKLGPTETSVLIRGETGTGKELVARAIHQLSQRASGPFRVFDCAVSNAELLHSDLFGHKKGSFTGADRDKVGAIEHARGGTILLSAVNELPIELQPRLLRVLETGEYQPLGGVGFRRADVRVLAKTQVDLQREVKAGRFRSDLFFRIAASTLEIPPLRERPEDIRPLVSSFAKADLGVAVKLSPSTLAGFQCDPWPGNVRELRNAVERVVSLGEASAPEIGASLTRSKYKDVRSRLLEKFERDYVKAVLDAFGGNIARAAREAGLSRMQLYRLMVRHKLSSRPPEK